MILLVAGVFFFSGGGGGVEEYQSRRSQYSRLYLGFTKLVNHFSHEQVQVIRDMMEEGTSSRIRRPIFSPF